MEEQAQMVAPVSRGVGLPFRRRDQFAQALVIAALFAAPAWVCIHMAVISDADVWWHMRTGEWILQHHAVPHTDPFSSFGAGKPWAAYTWLFDLLIYKCFQHWGLVGILLYSATMVSAITAALYHLVQRLQADFSIVVTVTCIAWSAMMPIYTPRPWLFTILFFALELDILMHARRTGKTRELLWLPLIFALWSNFHIQFIDGLLVLGIALAESFVGIWWDAARTRLPLRWIAPIFIACVVAPLANPYGWNIYKIAHDLATQAGALDAVAELQALPFRLLANYLMLFLGLAAAFAMGWSRRLALFEIVLFAFAALTTFRSQRDVWVLLVVASAIIAASIPSREEKRRPLPLFTVPVVVLGTAFFIFLAVRVMHVNNELLQSLLVKAMPVEAVNEVKAKGYAGPLYNNYDWGGFFIWYLRMPVSIDGRAALQGDDHMTREGATWDGAPDWITDPDLNSAGLVIGPIKSPLTQLLRMDPRFQLAYQDNIAAVFIARKSPAK